MKKKEHVCKRRVKNECEFVNNGFCLGGTTQETRFMFFAAFLVVTLNKSSLFKRANNLFDNQKLVLQLQHPHLHTRQQNFPNLIVFLFFCCPYFIAFILLLMPRNLRFSLLTQPSSLRLCKRFFNGVLSSIMQFLT